ncbi:MAG TPA: FAD-dependent oxidoreductase [Rhodothermales bacterium]|nr:FAD-dependent oxidoreductase [Rhodothermales bacterium]
MAEHAQLTGPDLTKGIPVDELAEGEMKLGHAEGEAVLLSRLEDGFFAIGATCTHYSGPLAEGLIVDDTVRCPWHHACFSLRTGEALRAPALNPTSCWSVEVRDGRVYVVDKVGREKLDLERRRYHPSDGEELNDIVVVGAGAAGDAAAEMLRREGFEGTISLVGKDQAAPYDRPNLSKDYLAGSAPEEWLPLRQSGFYANNDIDLVLGVQATSIYPDDGRVLLSNGDSLRFDRLLLATGATPVRLPVEGAKLPHVYYLRTLADCRAIIHGSQGAKRVVVIGASFIGMEAAASLAERGLHVAIVAPESQPMERILGPEIGKLVRGLHEEKGVEFYLNRTVTTIGSDTVTVSDGTELSADLVVVGIGVRPETKLAKDAGLTVDDGVIVDEYLETSHPGIFAAGDIARWPDRRSGRRVRVEHWVHAQRQGQVAARNLLGRREAFTMAPFFWTHQFDLSISYVGHAVDWGRIEVDGSIEDREFSASFMSGEKTLAVASVARGLENLRAEVAMERDDKEALPGPIAS